MCAGGGGGSVADHSLMAKRKGPTRPCGSRAMRRRTNCELRTPLSEHVFKSTSRRWREQRAERGEERRRGERGRMGGEKERMI